MLVVVVLGKRRAGLRDYVSELKVESVLVAINEIVTHYLLYIYIYLVTIVYYR